MSPLGALMLWFARHISAGVPVVVIDARENLFQALDEFNEQLKADREEDERGPLR